MTNSYTRVNAWGQRLRQAGLTALLVGGATMAAQAQLAYSATGAATVTGTYTDITATGTAIATANTDDANSTAQNIGFSFSYNNVSFTQFVLNTNGVIRLGSAAPSTTQLYYDNSGDTGVDPLQSADPADVNLLMPFNFDLIPGSGTGGTDYRVLTSGTAPNRVCTIQWRNVADKPGTGSDAANGTQYANFSFQLKLYETTNTVEFVYGQATAGATAGTRFPNVGLKGSGLASGQLALAMKTATTPWSGTTFQNTNYTNHANDITTSVLPDVGRTYRFTTAAPIVNDVSLSNVYTLGKIATTSALPSAVRTYIANLGTAAQSNVKVTLNVTGANTYTSVATITTLAAGAAGFVTVGTLPANMVPGTNTLTVSVADDDNKANNTATTTQLVTTNRVSYLDPSGTFSGSVGVGQAGGALAAKYTLPAATALSDVVLNFAASTNNNSPYQVVIYDATGTGATPGNILYTSPTQTRTPAASTATITVPTVQVPATFYIGIKELDTNPALAYQTEDPLRATTYYYSLNAATSWVSINNTTLRPRLAIEFGTVTPSCATPTALTVTTTTTTTATVAFTPPATGATTYQVVYGPVGFNPASSGTTITSATSPVTITGLAPATAYQVYVRSSCTAGDFSLFSAPVNFTTTCDPTVPITVFPYAQTFDTILSGQTLPCGITTADSNADGATWAISTENPNSGTNSMRYRGLVLTDVAANDWFFTPALTTTAGQRYQVAFRYRGYGVVNSTSAYTEKLEVKVGNAANAAAQTTTLYTNENIKNTSYAVADGGSTPVVATFTPGAGTRYVGFHVYSDKNQGNLYIDDLSITSAVVTATTSEALLKAVTVFPNPSTTGAFDLEIHGANAKGTLGVQVTNTLGQQVYTGTARDNYTNKLDLSGLAAGLYHLQVRNGEETLTRQIAIVK